ncbi:MAG: TIGR03960 family B12-binding radical SAM protein [Acidimicrobiia bacterium]|nr:TIGR03960 family B12-binding radical SAM protein [Acidimicrobiia bacterium]
MTSVWSRLEPLLPRVQKPARYIGCEDGAKAKAPDSALVNWCFIYPDTYEIGLPNQGLQILYEIVNERPDATADRSYAPWTDLEQLMRAEGIPLFSVEHHTPASSFDVLAFNLSAELTYTNLLNCVDLAGLSVRSAERVDDDPLVIAGGHCTYNPEPLALHVDAFVLGDGEEVVGEITEAILANRAREGAGRVELLESLAGIESVYVPSLYEVTYDGSTVASIVPRLAAAPSEVTKRTIADLAEWPYPKTQLAPLTEVVHDRLNVEVFRGCTRGCRFCQAGMITRPVRERPAEQVRTMVADGLARTGYDEVTLTSLSTADFSDIESVVNDIMDDSEADGTGTVSVSLPSLRVDAFGVGIAAQLQRARRTGLTFAPEAGTWRMRQIINKLIREEDLYKAVDAAYSQGWQRVKLYFLIGLPSETDEDTKGIAELARNCVTIGKRHNPRASVTVSVGGFVPKPFTPFQWFGQNTTAELQRKINLLRDATKKVKGVSLKWHDPKATLVEGIASRGDRRIGPVIEQVWRNGGTFQEWSEHFDLDLWLRAMADNGLTVEDTVYRHRTLPETQPWDHLSAGLHKDFLWQDWQDALAEVGLEDCRWTPCYDCGACTGYGIEHVVASATPPAGGSQGTGQDLAVGGAVPVQLLPRAAGADQAARRDRPEPASVGVALS